MREELIVKLKEGINYSSLLLDKILLEEQGNLKVERINELPVSQNMISDFESNAFENDEERENYVQQEILPLFHQDERNLYNIFKIDLGSQEQALHLKDSLEKNPDVEYVQFNQKNELTCLSSFDYDDEPLFTKLYGLQRMQCPEAWNISMGENIVVAVVDTGVDYNHPDLKDNMWRDINGYCGYDFTKNTYDPMDYHSHGTHVAGTISAAMNKMGVVGVAPKAKIMALKVFPALNDVVFHQAIKYAVDKGAHIINNSWGPTGRRPVNNLVSDAITYAVSKGVSVVFAAGNSSDDVSYYAPANHPDVICVGATDETDKMAGFSNYGDNITVSAPGKNILSCKFRSNDFIEKSGTSMSAPHVSGLLALILSKYKGMSPQALKAKIKADADPVESSLMRGSGRVNALKAVLPQRRSQQK